MIAKVKSASVVGLDAYPVEVEVDIVNGLPMFTIVGLPDAAVKESRDRVRAAVKNTGFQFPIKRITINMAPADVKKEGSGFDLPMALGILMAEGVLTEEEVKDFIVVGELSLNGEVRSIKGALSLSVAAGRLKGQRLILPDENADEAAVVKGVEVYGVKTLPQVVEFLSHRQKILPTRVNLHDLFSRSQVYDEDYADVKGQPYAKRAIEVAVAGGHNIILVGPPGSGKTMLAKRLPSIMPLMSFEEAIETTRIHSVSGTLPRGCPLISVRPFRSPHHTISDVGLIGGGQFPKPGEVSLAHNGVLFLDEVPEFHRNVLEVLRQPIEEGVVMIVRASASLRYPSTFMLVAAMNPCPCGYFTDPGHACRCSAVQIQRYRTRVSGPLMDRIDIHIEVPAVPFQELSMDHQKESSAVIRKRVHQARAIQQARLANDGFYCNAQLRPRQLRKHCVLDQESKRMIEMAMNRLGLSARGYNRILKVARTIADLEAEQKIKPTHVMEAIQYRSLDRPNVL